MDRTEPRLRSNQDSSAGVDVSPLDPPRSAAQILKICNARSSISIPMDPKVRPSGVLNGHRTLAVTDIPWPKNLAPKTDAKARKGTGGKLPSADVLVVTWTVDEGHALSRVLTPGKDSRNDYVPYKKNFAAISKKMRNGSPAKNAGRLGAYWTMKLGSKRVVVFKSESHMSQDTRQEATTGRHHASK